MQMVLIIIMNKEEIVEMVILINIVLDVIIYLNVISQLLMLLGVGLKLSQQVYVPQQQKNMVALNTQR